MKLGIIFSLIIWLFIFAEACGLTANQASSSTEAGCKLIEAFADNNVINSICATAPEIATIAADIINRRALDADSGADAGARKLEKCRNLPTTPICATETEFLAGIKAAQAARK